MTLLNYREMDLSIIIVNHNSERYLSPCLLSIKEALGNVSYEIILVDNGAKISPADFSSPNISVIKNRSDSSYSEASNLGAKHAKAPILWFLNPDTKLSTFNLPALIKLMQDSSVGMVGVKLIEESGKAQKWSAGFEITPLGILATNLGLVRSKKIWDSEQTLEVDWVSGCSFFTTKKLYGQLGGFDERFSMYFEDVDLGRRIRKMGKKVIFLPQIEVLHFGGKSFSHKSAQKKHYYASQRKYLEKHFGKLSATCIHLIRLLFSA